MEKVQSAFIYRSFALWYENAADFKLCNSRGQGHLGTIAKGHSSVVCQRFQRTSPLKLLEQFQLNLIC